MHQCSDVWVMTIVIYEDSQDKRSSAIALMVDTLVFAKKTTYADFNTRYLRPKFADAENEFAVAKCPGFIEIRANYAEFCKSMMQLIESCDPPDEEVAYTGFGGANYAVYLTREEVT